VVIEVLVPGAQGKDPLHHKGIPGNAPPDPAYDSL